LRKLDKGLDPRIECITKKAVPIPLQVVEKACRLCLYIGEERESVLEIVVIHVTSVCSMA
jgi:hypothetical protein